MAESTSVGAFVKSARQTQADEAVLDAREDTVVLGVRENDAILDARELVKRFAAPDGKSHHCAIDTVTLRLRAGALTAVVSPDGAGKTTLLRMAAGLLRPDAGTLRVLGLDVGDAKQAQRVQDRIGYMPQRFGLYEDLGVQENLDLYADLHGVPPTQRRERYAHLLAMTDLARFTDRPAGKLSGGMKQKLGLAYTLVRSPQLLLLDGASIQTWPASLEDAFMMLLRERHAARNAALVDVEAGKGLVQDARAPSRPQAPPKSTPQSPPRHPSEPRETPATVQSSPPPAIVVRDLVRRFGDFTAVASTSFTVRRGEIFGLLGPNGAGKTTTFRMLCGLLPATSGHLEVAGVDLRKARAQARERIGYVSQRFALYGSLSVHDNLTFFGAAYGLRGAALREREQGTFDQLLVTPLTPMQILIGKALPAILIGLAQSTLVLLIIIFWFRIPMAGSLWILYLGLLAFTVAAVGIGLSISALAMNMQQAMLYGFLLIMPLMLLSGLATPVRNMPQALQIATYANPLRFGVDIVRRVYLEGASLTDIAPDFVPLLAVAAVTLPLAAWLFRNRLA